MPARKKKMKRQQRGARGERGERERKSHSQANGNGIKPVSREPRSRPVHTFVIPHTLASGPSSRSEK